jgi:hypothetical protein
MSSIAASSSMESAAAQHDFASHADAQAAKQDGDASSSSSKKTKASKWADVAQGIWSGLLNIGSRAPVEGTPTWVTLEVLQGGFASGNYKAALKSDDASNESWLTAEGMERMEKMLETGHYHVSVPEHGAIPAIVWLLQQGREEDAKKILEEIQPWFSRLRFYPDAADTVPPSGQVVSVETVETVKDNLSELLQRATDLSNPSVVARIGLVTAMRYIMPLKWRMAALFLQTLQCQHAPSFQKADGKTVRNGQNPVYTVHADCPAGADYCGWPLQVFPEGWLEEAKVLLSEVDDAVPECKLNQACMQDGKGMGTLITVLRACCSDEGHKSLSGRTVSMLRNVLAGLYTRSGALGSEKYHQYHKRLQQMVNTVLEYSPPSEQIPPVLARLQNYAADQGLSSEAVVEVSEPVLISGKMVKLAPSITNQIKRATSGTLQKLINIGLVTSSEIVATLVGPIAAEAVSTAIENRELRLLSIQIRKAFFARRSLLLTNLQSQVKIHELPWTKPFVDLRSNKAGSSREVLEQIFTTCIKNFPQTILPNKLLQSMRSLILDAGIKELYMTDELAADIFYGSFSSKFSAMALVAAKALKGTLYERYYGLAEHWAELEKEGADAEQFSIICCKAAGVGRWVGYRGIAENGSIIEAQQVLTTHNLAQLVTTLDLKDKVDWNVLVIKTWNWILELFDQLVKPGASDWRGSLQNGKDVAYAWRQLIFYMSMMTPENMESCLRSLVIALSGKTTQIVSHAWTVYLAPLTVAFAGQNSAFAKPVYGWNTHVRPAKPLP